MTPIKRRTGRRTLGMLVGNVVAGHAAFAVGRGRAGRHRTGHQVDRQLVEQRPATCGASDSRDRILASSLAVAGNADLLELHARRLRSTALTIHNCTGAIVHAVGQQFGGLARNSAG